MTWRQKAAAIIAEATRGLPDDTAMPHRIKVIDAARSHSGGCSWPRKAWQAARRDYLVRFGYQPKTKRAQERKMAVAEDLPLFEREG